MPPAVFKKNKNSNKKNRKHRKRNNPPHQIWFSPPNARWGYPKNKINDQREREWRKNNSFLILYNFFNQTIKSNFYILFINFIYFLAYFNHFFISFKPFFLSINLIQSFYSWHPLLLIYYTIYLENWVRNQNFIKLKTRSII
jgi:hypothetical protein